MRKMFDFLRSLINEDEKPKGTYVGVRLAGKSKSKIRKVAKEIGVPNMLANSQMHITVIFSRKHLPDYKPLGKLKEQIDADVDKLHVFQKPEPDSPRILVLLVKSPELTKRHEAIMKEHGATYDFDEYIPHITLSYDCGDYDETEHDIKEYFVEPLLISEEYAEELKLDGYE